MYPELFTFSIFGQNVVIMAYSFFYILASIFVIIASYFSARHNNFSVRQTFCLLGGGAVAGLLGARLLHFIFNPSMYDSGSSLHLFDLQMHGFTIVGGLIFAVMVGWVIGKLCNIDIWKFGDVTIPFVAFGIAIARVGCFLNGCCFGQVTHAPWGVRFPTLSFAHQYQIMHGLSNIFVVLPVHPTQIYELIYAVLGGVIVIFINKKNIFAGAGILFIGMWFSIFRIVNMYFRQLLESLTLSVVQYTTIYILIFIGSLLIFIYKYNQINKNNILVTTK